MPHLEVQRLLEVRRLFEARRLLEEIRYTLILINEWIY